MPELEGKVAVIYGAAGAIGKEVAKAFAREGARVFAFGRHLDAVEKVAAEIRSAGGNAEAASVDALDEAAVAKNLDEVVKKAGRVDVSFTSISIPQPGIQGIPLVQLSTEKVMEPIDAYAKSYFVTTQAAARIMVQQKGGVILLHTPEVTRVAAPLTGGMNPAWAAMEALNRSFSSELAQYGVRTVNLRSTGLPETKTIDIVFGLHAKTIGIPVEQFRGFIENMTHIKRSTTLREVADAAVFAASDRASSMTAATLNITGGMVID